MKVYAMRTREEGELTHLSTYTKVPFIILCCLWRRLSLLYKKALAMIIFLSLKSFSLFLYVLIDWIFEGFPIRNGGLDGKEYVSNGSS